MVGSAFRFVTALVGLGLLAGCPVGGNPGDAIVDPPSNAPELEGRWCLQTDEQGFVGFFELDETGDPSSVEDNPTLLDFLDTDRLTLDGQPQVTDMGFQLTGAASSSLQGETMQLFLEMHVFSFGFESGALALKFEGRRVSPDRVEGTAVTIRDFPVFNTEGTTIEVAAATRNACDQ